MFSPVSQMDRVPLIDASSSSAVVTSGSSRSSRVIADAATSVTADHPSSAKAAARWRRFYGIPSCGVWLTAALLVVVYWRHRDGIATTDGNGMELALGATDRLRHFVVLAAERSFQRNVGSARINDADHSVQRQNADPLPTSSHFGTRAEDVAKICRGDDAARCVPKLQHSASMFMFERKRKLLTCLITKNMSTILRALFCYLSNPERFVATGRQIHSEVYGSRLCKSGNSFTSDRMAKVIPRMFNMTEEEIMEHWRPFVMVRDPVDRFLSAFIDKCIRRPFVNEGYCGGCGHNMTCFLMAEHKRMMDAHGMNFNRYEDVHFFPQNWECNFREHLARFETLRYDSRDVVGDVEQLVDALARRGVPAAQLEFIRADLSTKRTLHSTITSPTRRMLEQRLRGSAFLMEFVARMYYWDFQLFNYAIPALTFP